MEIKYRAIVQKPPYQGGGKIYLGVCGDNKIEVVYDAVKGHPQYLLELITTEVCRHNCKECIKNNYSDELIF